MISKTPNGDACDKAQVVDASPAGSGIRRLAAAARTSPRSQTSRPFSCTTLQNTASIHPTTFNRAQAVAALSAFFAPNSTLLASSVALLNRKSSPTPFIHVIPLPLLAQLLPLQPLPPTALTAHAAGSGVVHSSRDLFGGVAQTSCCPETFTVAALAQFSSPRWADVTRPPDDAPGAVVNTIATYAR
jgi:hypothetical protein